MTSIPTERDIRERLANIEALREVAVMRENHAEVERLEGEYRNWQYVLIQILDNQAKEGEQA